MYRKFGLTNQSEQSCEQTYFSQRFPTCMQAARGLNFKLIPAFLCPGVVAQNWSWKILKIEIRRSGCHSEMKQRAEVGRRCCLRACTVCANYCDAKVRTYGNSLQDAVRHTWTFQMWNIVHHKLCFTCYCCPGEAMYLQRDSFSWS